MSVSRFEELEVWNLARHLYKFVFELTLRKPFCHDFGLRDQIRNSSGSISDNIAEGFGRGGNKEFIQFLFFSRGSNSECRNQGYRAFDSNYIADPDLNELLELTDKINGKLTNLIKSLQRSEGKGLKFDDY